jgi:hypothetical protein
MTKLPTRAALLTSTAMTGLPTLAFNTSVRRGTGVDENCAIAARTSMAASVRLSTGELDENRAIEIADCWVSTGLRTDKEYSREWLQTTLEEGLEEGDYKLAIWAVEVANTGDEICDAALRTVAGKILDDALPERKPGHMQVRTYGQRALNQPPHKRPRGRNWHDNLIEDLQTLWYVVLACHAFRVLPTRNREEGRADRRHGDRAPSGISIIVEALARHGIHRNEASVQNLWSGPKGKLVRKLARYAPRPTGNCG